MNENKWVTPFVRQCFVTAGVAINGGQFGLVMGFTAVLLPQLKRPDSMVPINDTSASWIAAAPGFTLLLGNITVPTVMGRCGRKIANLTSIIIACIGWFGIVGAQNTSALLIARILQGLSMGMIVNLSGILIGEYTSPKNRGAFISTTGFSISIGILISHAAGSYLSWKSTALICAVLSIINLFIVIFSPESPSWLSDQGRYEDCKRVFHWLRGYGEEEELNKIIKASQFSKQSKTEAKIVETFRKKFRRSLRHFIVTIKRNEFYKPIIISMHMYLIGNCGGSNFLSVYPTDTFNYVMNTDKYNTLLLISMDIQRIVTNFLIVCTIRRVKRRTMVFVTMNLNILALIGTGVYAYAKIKGMLLFDHPSLGAILIHIHTFASCGTLSLPVVVSGEIFPLQYKSLAAGISTIFYSLSFVISVKTGLILYKTVGLHGTYFIYAGMLLYCIVIIWFTLSETKGRTLQNIEEEFRGMKFSPEELNSLQSLNSYNPNE